MAPRKNAQGTVVSQVANEDPKAVSVDLPADPPKDGPLAEVTVTYGLTVNLGSYESARVDVALRFPCATNQVQETYEKVKKWCEDKIKAEVRSIRGHR